jgi:hypothetical protein
MLGLYVVQGTCTPSEKWERLRSRKEQQRRTYKALQCARRGPMLASRRPYMTNRVPRSRASSTVAANPASMRGKIATSIWLPPLWFDKSSRGPLSPPIPQLPASVDWHHIAWLAARYDHARLVQDIALAFGVEKLVECRSSRVRGAACIETVTVGGHCQCVWMSDSATTASCAAWIRNLAGLIGHPRAARRFGDSPAVRGVMVFPYLPSL